MSDAQDPEWACRERAAKATLENENVEAPKKRGRPPKETTPEEETTEE